MRFHCSICVQSDDSTITFLGPDTHQACYGRIGVRMKHGSVKLSLVPQLLTAASIFYIHVFQTSKRFVLKEIHTEVAFKNSY